MHILPQLSHHRPSIVQYHVDRRLDCVKCERVAALLSLQPELSSDLSQPRLLHVSGEKKPEWMTEGDKLRLRRKGRKFVDITEHEEFYANQVDAESGKASK